MPRRTYDPRNGRRRPYSGMAADTLRGLMAELRRQDRPDPSTWTPHTARHSPAPTIRTNERTPA